MVATTVARDDSLASSSVVAMKRSSDAAEMCCAAAEADGWSVTRLPWSVASVSQPLAQNAFAAMFLSLKYFKAPGWIGNL